MVVRAMVQDMQTVDGSVQAGFEISRFTPRPETVNPTNKESILSAQSDQVRSNSINFKKGIRIFLLTASLLGSAWVIAQEPVTQNTPASADSTKLNQRDRDANQPTANQQKNNRSDRDITRQIRQALVKNKALSTYAHNVKIITQNGQVTLKGPVRSDEEKRAVEAKAAEVAGGSRVNSQLDVKPNNSNN
jgi:hyperosmotically inducible protein